MLPQIFSDINHLPSTRLVYNDIHFIKITTIYKQCTETPIQDHMAHTSNTIKSPPINPKRVKNPPDGFCTCILFSSAIIPIFSGYIST